MPAVDPAASSATGTGNSHDKVQDEKLDDQWFPYTYLWCGSCRRMPDEFANVRKMYPKIPAEKVDIAVFFGETLTTKMFRALNISLCTVRVKADFKGKELVKRTMFVTGRDVAKLEAAVESLSKQQQQ